MWFRTFVFGAYGKTLVHRTRDTVRLQYAAFYLFTRLYGHTVRSYSVQGLLHARTFYRHVYVL